jgi:DNA-binding SARP family transcriptional activator
VAWATSSAQSTTSGSVCASPFLLVTSTDAALAALRADDLRESAHRIVIKIHLAEGNLVEARRAYGTCRTLLVHALGIEPSPMTSRLLRTDAVPAG